MSPCPTQSIIYQLEEFVNSKYRNMWLDDGILTIYVRRSMHIIDNEYVECLDVANIQPIDPDYEHKGYFKRFMEKAETLGLSVFVECIHNPNLIEMLRKHGYVIIRQDNSTHALKRFDK
jgi:hypothetical protein